MTTPRDNSGTSSKSTGFASREEILLRIREIERQLEKWEREDEEYDVELMEGHIRLTRGSRFGCGIGLLCIAAMALRVVIEGHKWAWTPLAFFGIAAIVMILRGFMYRPSARAIVENYTPHRTQEAYQSLVREMERLTRRLAEELGGR